MKPDGINAHKIDMRVRGVKKAATGDEHKQKEK